MRPRNSTWNSKDAETLRAPRLGEENGEVTLKFQLSKVGSQWFVPSGVMEDRFAALTVTVTGRYVSCCFMYRFSLHR